MSNYLNNSYYLIKYLFLKKYNCSKNTFSNIFKYIKSHQAIIHPIIPLIIKSIKIKFIIIDINKLNKPVDIISNIKPENNIYYINYRYKYSNISYKKYNNIMIPKVVMCIYCNKIPRLPFGKIFYEYNNIYDMRSYIYNYPDLFRLWNLGHNSQRKLKEFSYYYRENIFWRIIHNNNNNNNTLKIQKLDNYIKNNYMLYSEYLQLFEKYYKIYGNKLLTYIDNKFNFSKSVYISYI